MGIKRQYGISLIEILVAMAVGAILLNAIIQVAVANGFATRKINGLSSLQDNARVSLDKVTDSLRSAGHYGGTKRDSVDEIGTISVTGIGGCNRDWILDTSTYIQGYEGAATITSVTGLPSGCIPSNQYVPNSDIVSVRYASARDATPIASLVATKIYYRSVDGATGARGAELLLGANIASSRYGGGSDGVGTYNYEYKTELYFLRPCSAVVSSACDDGLGTLVRYTLDGTTLVVEAIAEGVEQFQIEYGVDTANSDYVADTYMSANAVTDWASVVSARYSIVVRSESRDTNFSDTASYGLAGGFSYTPVNSVANYARKAFTRVVQLRNMSRG